MEWEGRRYNETFLFEGHQWLVVDKQEGVFAGGKAEYTGVKTFEVYEDYQKGCLDDIRLDGKHLPLPPAMNGTQWGQATMARNLQRNCPSNKPCMNVICPEPFECVDSLNDYECSCGEGQSVSADGKGCTDKNECLDQPCLNGGTCINQDPRHRYRCICPGGFWGDNCELMQEGQTLKLGVGALAAILTCLLTILIIVLVFVLYNRRREPHAKHTPPHDDVRENIINYADEGGGEDDMTVFDIKPLQIPVEGTDTDIPNNSQNPRQLSEKTNQSSTEEQKEKADNDIDAPPFDELRNFTYEGGGSTAGSLSSLTSGTDDSDQDYEYLERWGPRFDKLASLYGQEDNVNEEESEEDNRKIQ
uniref:(California timema) hypothetical protein n=1 Tax=Timema californicum TaxID=61474 RepID=A0A7R9PA64_TIMCA|nr:unnamed protein product [Timema californicum]